MGEDATKIGAPEFERLFDFLDDLRASGYIIDTRQLMALNDLLLALAANGETFDDFGHLKTLIAPLICATPAEQDDFYQRFDTFVGINKPRISATAPQAQLISEKQDSPKFRNPFDEAGALLTNWFVKPFSEIYKQNQFLTRETTDKIPEIIRFSVDPLLDHIFPRIHVHLTAKEFRRRRQVVSNEIDIDKTIETFIAQNGWINLVYQHRQIMPEYLVLIDRRGRIDQQARFADEIFKEISANGVWIHTYYFNGDPRICFASNQQDAPLPLHELQARYRDCRLIILTEAGTFINPISGELLNWVQELFYWEDRAIFLPVPEQGRGYVCLLAQDFAVLPLSLVNLAGYLSSLNNEKSLSGIYDENQAMPESLLTRPLRWLLRDPLPESEVSDMLANLRIYLGALGYYWLAACAVYPELHWEITLYLGNTIKDETGIPLLDTTQLQKLARLPWLRRGYMPDWFRLALIGSMNTQQDTDVRHSVNKLLSTAKQKKGEFELKFANQSKNLLIESAKTAWQAITGRTSDNRDVIFIRFLNNPKKRKLSIQLNDAIQKLQLQSINSVQPIRNFAENLFSMLGRQARKTYQEPITLVGDKDKRSIASIKILDGPENIQGQELLIYTERVSFGRDPQLVDFVFYTSDVYSSVSPRHAILERINGEWRIVNESNSGTFLDDKVLSSFEPQSIKSGQIVCLGFPGQNPVRFEFTNLEPDFAPVPKEPEKPKVLQVFLSCAVQTHEVQQLYFYLKNHGINVWLDSEDLNPGQEWLVETQNAIRSADVIVVCLTKNSLDKPNFAQKEKASILDMALERTVAKESYYIIPIRLDECNIPSQLSGYRYLDLFTKDGKSELLAVLSRRAQQIGCLPVEFIETIVQQEQDKRIRVAILEDHQGIIDGYLYRLNAKSGIDVVGTALYGEDLEPMLANQVVDVLLSGVNNPVSKENRNLYNILQVVPKLIIQYPGLHILIISMVSQPAIIEALIKAGISGYITKDDQRSLQELSSIIEMIAAGEKYFSPKIRKQSLPAVELTHRQREILSLCADYPDKTTTEIADRLGITNATARSLLSSAYTRLGVHTRAAAIARAQNLQQLTHSLEKSTNKPNLNDHQLQILSGRVNYPDETTSQIGDRLGISRQRVSQLISEICFQLSVDTLEAAMIRAQELGILADSKKESAAPPPSIAENKIELQINQEVFDEKETLFGNEKHLYQGSNVNAQSFVANLREKTLLGRYAIRDLIGQGAFTSVYSAWDESRKSIVAIKVLRTDNESARQLFDHEAQILSRLSHPNILKFFSIEHDGEMSFWVTEYLNESKSLADMLQTQRGHPLAFSKVSELLEQISGALDFIHTRGIGCVELSLKSIMLQNDKRVVFFDLGSAQFLSDNPQIRGADILALGKILYLMLSGGLPISNGQSLLEINPDVSEAINQVVLRALDKNPRNRYQSAIELFRGFEKARVQSLDEYRQEGKSPAPLFNITDARMLLRQVLAYREAEWMPASELKKLMLRLNPVFNERNYGFTSFKDFLQAQQNILNLRMSSDHLEVQLAPQSSTSPESRLEQYLQILAVNKIPITPNEYRPAIIFKFHEYGKEGGLSLTQLKSTVHAYFEETESHVIEAYITEVAHQLFHTYCFLFDQEDGDHPADFKLWDRRVNFVPEVIRATDLLDKCDKGILRKIIKSLDAPEKLDKEVAARVLYGSFHGERMLNHVNQLLINETK